ncbi:MAG: hypothetical protein AAB890_02025 [Patescibacteria group bacterium]
MWVGWVRNKIILNIDSGYGVGLYISGGWLVFVEKGVSEADPPSCFKHYGRARRARAPCPSEARRAKEEG